MYKNDNENVERVQDNVRECWDERSQEFDWEQYSYLCSIADYWDMEE